MAKSNIVIKNIKLTVSMEELDMITDSLNNVLEDMETGNDDLSLRTINAGKFAFYKVDKGLCPHMRECYIKTYRLSTQLNRLYHKVSSVNDLPWRTTKQLAMSK